MVLESNGNGVVSVSSSAVSSVREAPHLPPCHGDEV
jgi:hypothetical protein